MTASRLPKQKDAGPLLPEIRSFRLHLAAEGKSAKTIRTYGEAAAWFAAARLLGGGKSAWRQADRRDVQEWMAWLLGRYSDSYARNQYRALQQFFKWLAAEDELPDPMAGRLSPSRSSQSGSFRGWSVPARAAASGSGATRRSSRC